MNIERFTNKAITGTLLFLVMSIVYAGAPLWTFKPLTATTVSVLINDTATITYQITNQSRKTHTLVITPIPGVSQVPVSGNGNCANPFTLAYKESCTLNLQVTGSALKGPVFGGPKICSQGNLLQCYQPSQADSLNITVMINNALSAAVTPSSLAVGVGQTATFTATPSGGTAPYSYQWYSCTTADCSSPTVISGATHSTYSPYPAAGTYYYQAIVTDSIPNTATTPSATLTVASQYAYVGGGETILWQCPMTATGGISGSACTTLTNSTSPGFTNAYTAIFSVFSGTTYAYVVDDSIHLWKCPMNATGGFSGGCTALTNATSPGFNFTEYIAFATFSSTLYAYVADYSTTLWKCPMTTTGNFSSGCTALTNATSPGFATTGGITFAVFSGTTYAYVADSTSTLWKCPMTTTGSFSGGCTALTNATSPGFGYTAPPTFATFSGVTYAYVGDSTANLWECQMTSTGNISGDACTLLTNGTSPGFQFTVTTTFATF